MLLDKFTARHIGPRPHEIQSMLDKIGVNSIDELIDKTIPSAIRLKEDLPLTDGMNEFEYMKYITAMASKNKIFRSYIGLGFFNTIMPAVIQRNILENPSWYTSYTPYQAEISQGRLEALLNFQTMIISLTGMEIANASMLDEATAAAEAMNMLFNARSKEKKNAHANIFLVDEHVLPQTIDVLRTRSGPLGIDVRVLPHGQFNFTNEVFGAFVQYPNADGLVEDHHAMIESAHGAGCNVVVGADPMSLSMLIPPGEWGADVVVGSTQRFGLPMGCGGPHAAYFATREQHKRIMPGRIIGVSIDKHGKKALRMALQTREQHIKRERATSNICTSQALLAIMASMYAVYHGKEGIKKIATHIQSSAVCLAERLQELGFEELNNNYFDTIKIKLIAGVTAQDIERIALLKEINLRYITEDTVGISIDETVTSKELNNILEVFAIAKKKQYQEIEKIEEQIHIAGKFIRKSDFLNEQVFNRYQSETELMRYIKRLEQKDISLTHSMIPLGSCTMKLNAAIEMMALTLPGFAEIHPFVPIDQIEGYHELFYELGNTLKIITGFEGISFQPNSGAAGEYAGLMVVNKYHESRKEKHRTVVLVPASAHGTNPASAAMAGMQVVVVNCDEKGNIDIADLRLKAEQYKDTLAAFMVTYPSTHGVFESKIIEMNEIIHSFGGLVYMDGANMNAQVGYTNPSTIGADVCHLNLHKTFGNPHGGGGPGVGPICVGNHLIEFLPTHPIVPTGGVNGVGAVSAAPWGSALILTIAHAYCSLLGGKGLKEATRFAILNANYIAASLRDHYNVLYKGEQGFVAHEMIFDCRDFKHDSEITEVDIAKRLMDYGFHAPTLSFPVHGTLMVEPTESESLQELDRFIEAMISIKKEIEEVAQGVFSKQDNVLKNAPHTAEEATSDEWVHAYPRKKAVYPLSWIIDNKYWPTVGRIDDAFGDRNLQCMCSAFE